MLKYLIIVIILIPLCYIFELPDVDGSDLHHPTYDEMMCFLESDTTDLNEYNNSYNCRTFTNDLIRNARKQDIQSGFVSLDIANSSIYHSAVAFFTDRGIYIVEPQTDDFIVVNDYENYEIEWNPRLYDVDR